MSGREIWWPSAVVSGRVLTADIPIRALFRVSSARKDNASASGGSYKRNSLVPSQRKKEKEEKSN